MAEHDPEAHRPRRPEPTPGAPPPPPDVVLGVDYGQVRVGLALGHADSGLVLGLPVLHHPGDDEGLALKLAEIARARDATVVVLGHPVHKSGKASPQSRKVEKLRDRLVELIPRIRLELEDERHTSQEAEASLADAGLRWWQFPKSQIDTAAAIAIVRSWLVRRNPALALERAEPEPPPAPDPPREASRKQRRKAARRRRGQDEPVEDDHGP